jgi:hypothetical protein
MRAGSSSSVSLGARCGVVVSGVEHHALWWCRFNPWPSRSVIVPKYPVFVSLGAMCLKKGGTCQGSAVLARARMFMAWCQSAWLSCHHSLVVVADVLGCASMLQTYRLVPHERLVLLVAAR